MSSMPEQPRAQYQIAKTVFEGRICSSCGGKKTREINLGNKQFKTVNCSTCDGSGVYMHQRTEYIDIRQAMEEIGIGRMIANTVKEILASTSSAADALNVNSK